MSKFYSAETQQGHSTRFFQYIRSIAEATSKQEEDQCVEEDLKSLKAKLTSSTARDEDRLKEYAVRAYYAELMGHTAEFAYIYCINLACSPKLLHKRTGYLATGLMVNPESELMYLIVSSIQRDLKSPNYLEVAAALTAAAKMLRPELMTVVQGDLGGLLTHEKPLVRRKAVEAMHAFYARSDATIGDVAAFRQALCDRDPSVMDAATRLLQEVIQRDPDSQRDLLDSFVLILTQVIERRLPRTYDYHHMPAPWLQLRLIQLLTMLIGNSPQRAAKAAYVLEEAMQRADNGKLIGFAVICELVRTASTIPALPKLLSLSAEAVSGLITARSQNLRCAGIQALSYMVRVKPELAAEHQEVVMRCLEDEDETIRRKTIWLLFAICSNDNVGPIAHRLIRFLSKVSDPFLKRSTTRGLCKLMEQHATDPWWYIRTMNKVLAVAPECVLPATLQRMLKLIAEGQGTDEAADTAFRIRCVDAYFAITGGQSSALDGVSTGVSSGKKTLDDGKPGEVSDVLRRIGAWVMGEYGFLANKLSAEMLVDRLCDMMEQTEDGETRCWILTALMKATTGQVQQSPTNANGASAAEVPPDYVDELIAQFQSSRCVPLQQRCYEFAGLRRQPELWRRVLPKDGFCEEVQVDPALHFLDNFVEVALERGAPRYAQPADVAALRQQSDTAKTLSNLRTDAYVPTRPLDIRPEWLTAPVSSSSASPPADASVTGAVPSARAPWETAATHPATNAALAQSVLQGSERLLLQPTATKRWGAQNLREAEAAEEEVHLQVAAAAAVGGGGIVWGADTLQTFASPNSTNEDVALGEPAHAEKSASVTPGFAHERGAAAAASDSATVATVAAGSAGSVTDGKAVSAKNAKFVRSIFGGGRRKAGPPAASPAAALPSSSSVSESRPVAAPAQQQVTLSAPTPNEKKSVNAAAPPPSSIVMDSLFASQAAHTSAARVDPAQDWFNASDNTHTGPRQMPSSDSSSFPATSSSLLQPVSASFTTEQFGRHWQLLGVSGECTQQLQFPDISDYDRQDGILQQYLRRTSGLRVVQIIGAELIAAGQRTTPDDGKAEYVLAHLTVVSASKLSVVMRSPQRELSENVLRALETL